MFLDLTAQVTKAKFACVLRTSSSEIVSQFHFFRFSLFELAVKNMIIQTKHCLKKYLKVRPNLCTTVKSTTRTGVSYKSQTVRRKVSQIKRGKVQACFARVCPQRSAVVRTEHE